MRSSISAVLVIASACLSVTASAQARTEKAAQVSRTTSDTARMGAYELELLSDNGTLVGTLSIKRAAEGLQAVLFVGGHSPDVKSFVHTGAAYVLEASTASFTVTYKLVFAADSLHGTYQMSTGPSGLVSAPASNGQCNTTCGTRFDDCRRARYTLPLSLRFSQPARPLR